MNKIDVICNTSPIIGLIGINRLDLLCKLILNVKKEMDRLRDNGYYISDKLYRNVLEKMLEM